MPATTLPSSEEARKLLRYLQKGAREFDRSTAPLPTNRAALLDSATPIGWFFGREATPPEPHNFVVKLSTGGQIVWCGISDHELRVLAARVAKKKPTV